MAYVKLRDRDAIATREGLVFRVLGCVHPADFYVCDAEYGSDSIFKSDNPKAFRKSPHGVWYKFFEDEAWKLLERSFPKYLIFDETLHKNIVGVRVKDVLEIRRPQERLRALVEENAKDPLLKAAKSVIGFVLENTAVSLESLGVFGSLLHGFYHPDYSDIDLIVYGQENVQELSKALEECYESPYSALSNEFASKVSVRTKPWRFRNFSLDEYWWHQRRKLIYAVFNDGTSGREIKVEFEPVKDWKEITDGDKLPERVQSVSWVKILAEVKDDRQSAFIPSLYEIKPVEVVEGPDVSLQVTRVVSYVEEFRRQAVAGELVQVEGHLERVTHRAGDFYQIVLTWCPRYYEQVLRVVGQVRTGIK